MNTYADNASKTSQGASGRLHMFPPWMHDQSFIIET